MIPLLVGAGIVAAAAVVAALSDDDSSSSSESPKEDLERKKRLEEEAARRQKKLQEKEEMLEVVRRQLAQEIKNRGEDLRINLEKLFDIQGSFTDQINLQKNRNLESILMLNPLINRQLESAFSSLSDALIIQIDRLDNKKFAEQLHILQAIYDIKLMPKSDLLLRGDVFIDIHAEAYDVKQTITALKQSL